MSIRSEPLANGKPEESKRKPPRIGFVRPRHVERAFILLLYATLLALVVLSVVGTFYGLAGESAPLLAPRQILVDIRDSPDLLWMALAIQLFLTLGQYGARQYARVAPRWWFLYLVTLGISVYYNVLAYWAPLNTFLPGVVAGLLIVAGDVLPEFIAVRHE